ncbi:MAG: aldo/keto reductase [Clostridiales Family XIII bacterium]|nr:aldo/keto reductase [Clostridiales Family XIII bacterium]
MKKSALGKTGIQVTPVGCGVLTVGRSQLGLPVGEGAGVVRRALERGINFLDTAQYYRTYPYIREALRGTGFEPVISSKCLGGSYGAMRDAVEEARAGMDRDAIDIFLLHELRHGGDWESRRGAWEYLMEAKAKGLVRAIGISTHHVDVAERAASELEMDVLFPLINREGLGIRRGAGAGGRDEMAAAIKKAGEAGIGVFAMKALGGGNLVGGYIAALDYVRGLPGVVSVMVGLGSIDEADRLAEYAEGRLDVSYRPDISGKRMRVDRGDCEGCGACVGRCPSHAVRLTGGGFAEIDPAKCLNCGYCAPVCPTRAIIFF